MLCAEIVVQVDHCYHIHRPSCCCCCAQQPAYPLPNTCRVLMLNPCFAAGCLLQCDDSLMQPHLSATVSSPASCCCAFQSARGTAGTVLAMAWGWKCTPAVWRRLLRLRYTCPGCELVSRVLQLVAFAQNSLLQLPAKSAQLALQASLELSLALNREVCSMLSWLVVNTLVQEQVGTCPCGASLLSRP